jgi:hypothetical protein
MAASLFSDAGHRRAIGKIAAVLIVEPALDLTAGSFASDRGIEAWPVARILSVDWLLVKGHFLPFSWCHFSVPRQPPGQRPRRFPGR